MRMIVTCALLVLLATIACVDPLCCSDGCDRGGMAVTHSTPTGADCPSCLSTVVPDHAMPIVRVEIVMQMHEPRTQAPASVFRPDVDHPPRFA